MLGNVVFRARHLLGVDEETLAWMWTITYLVQQACVTEFVMMQVSPPEDSNLPIDLGAT